MYCTGFSVEYKLFIRNNFCIFPIARLRWASSLISVFAAWFLRFYHIFFSQLYSHTQHSKSLADYLSHFDICIRIKKKKKRKNKERNKIENVNKWTFSIFLFYIQRQEAAFTIYSTTIKQNCFRIHKVYRISKKQ